MHHDDRPSYNRFPHTTPITTVIFDFDGTLTEPGSLDYDEIRTALGSPRGESILDYIASIDNPEERKNAWDVLQAFEDEGARTSRPNPDVREVMAFCRAHGLKTSVISRNSRRSLDIAFAPFEPLSPRDFTTIITRDDPIPAKPAPEGIFLACSRMGTRPEASVMVGDYIYDVEAGRNAGSISVLFDSDPSHAFDRPDADHVIYRLRDLIAVLRLYLPAGPGKLPNDLLRVVLSTIAGTPRAGFAGTVSLGVGLTEAGGDAPPAVGEDAAILALPSRATGSHDGASREAAGTGGIPEGGHLLIACADPVTLARKDAGRMLVTVNENDIAAAGGTMRWMLLTVLAPPGTLPIEIARLLAETAEACRGRGARVCGGHTEITDAVTRIVVSAAAIGTASPARVKRKTDARPGDALILTKAIALEGTAILAGEHSALLREHGVADEVIARAAGFAERTSISTEAMLAATVGGTGAMHDVTEGGAATALRELSEASGHRLHVELDAIPILPECRTICDALALDPLGLIGSGSLLVCVRAEGADRLLRTLRDAGVGAERIGRVGEAGYGVVCRFHGTPAELPSFEVDEITRAIVQWGTSS